MSGGVDRDGRRCVGRTRGSARTRESGIGPTRGSIGPTPDYARLARFASYPTPLARDPASYVEVSPKRSPFLSAKADVEVSPKRVTTLSRDGGRGAAPTVWVLVLLISASVSAQVPPRDTSAPAVMKGTSVIRGRVIASDGERPLERARLTLSGGTGVPPSVNTDTLGRYEFTEIPPGRYILRASRSGYLGLSHGQRRPLEAGRPIELGDGETIENVNFALPRMSVISGRIVDELGEVMAGVSVAAMRHEYFEGQRQLVRVSDTARTDDTGAYRVTGLAPGEYYLYAFSRETWVDLSTKAVLAYAHTYYPGTANASEAQRVKVGLGQEARAIDFALFPSRAATISGSAFNSRGQPAAGLDVSLTQVLRGRFGSGFIGSNGARVGADGTFRIRDVVPGEYSLSLRIPASKDSPTAESIELPLVVTGSDISDVRLAATAPGTFSGRVVADNGERPPISRERLRVVSAEVNRVPRAAVGSPQGAVRDDYSFELTGLTGRQRISMLLPDDWSLKAISVGSRDYVDAPVDFSRGEQLSGAVIVLTNKITKLNGRVLDKAGSATADATIVAFSAAPEKWGMGSRYVKIARPDQQGRYEIKGLPHGPYLVVALDYVEDGQHNDPEFLKGLRDTATALTLGEAEVASLELRVR